MKIFPFKRLDLGATFGISLKQKNAFRLENSKKIFGLKTALKPISRKQKMSQTKTDISYCKHLNFVI